MTTSVFVFGIKIWTLLRGTECHVKWLKAPALIPFWRHFLEGIIRIFVLDLVPNLKMHSWSFSGPKIILCQTYVSVCLKLLLQSMPRKYCQNILVWFCHLQICGKEILKGIYILFFGLGLGLWCLMSLSTIFQLYRDGQFYWVPGENHWPVTSLIV